MRRSGTISTALVSLLALACDGSDPADTSSADEPRAAGEPAAATDPPSSATPDDADPAEDETAEDDGGGDAPPATPAPDVKPEDWGQLKPPHAPPAEDALTVHGLAGFPVVTVYAEPNLESARLGYLRFGQRVMVAEKVDDEGEGCPKGFHALPTGGYACASKGLLVDADKEPYMYLPPPPPRVDEPLPYDYGTIAKDGTPMWWRVPDRDEVMLAQEKWISTLPPEERPEKPADKTKSGDKDKPAEALPGVTDPDTPVVLELTEEEKEKARQREEARKKAEEERAAELAAKAAKLPLNGTKPFMEKGFTITLGEKVKEKGRTWWRTTRGGFVDASHAWRKKGQDFVGAEVPETSDFPFGFVMEEEAAASILDDSGKLKWKRKLEFREFVDITEEKELDGKTWLVTTDGLYLRPKDVRVAERAERPKDVAAWEGWIDVSLQQQILVAYEGDRPVYVTLVSTGKKGTDEESFETPKGTYRIGTKHISSSMDGTTASDGNYSIQDVPWAMFFEGSYALHGAFWHSRFGYKRSHGCVNLGPTDARWLFYWTTPYLPEGWHGVRAHEGAPGTTVVIR